MSNDKNYRLLDIENIIGIIIGIAPLIVIWLIFKNDDVRYMMWISRCSLTAQIVSVVIALSEIFVPELEA